MKLSKNFAFAFVTCFLMPTCLCLIAYDCHGPENLERLTLSLVTQPRCKNHSRIDKVEKKEVVITQVTELLNLKYFRCSIEAFHHLWRCGKSIDTGFPAGIYSEIITPNKQECMDMIKSRKYRVTAESGPIEIRLDTKTDFSFTSRGFISGDGSCSPGLSMLHNGVVLDRPVQNTKLTITAVGGEAKVILSQDKIIFPNGNRCKYSSGSCELADYGSVFWDIELPVCGVESHKVVLYSGVADVITDTNKRKFLQVTTEDLDFQLMLLSRTVKICGFESVSTEHPGIFATVMKKGGPSFPITSKMVSSDVDFATYINNKIVYSARHTKNEVSRLFEIFSLDRCETLNKISSGMMISAASNPREFSFHYFGSPGYTALVRGEVVHITKCSPVAVEPTNLKGQCYNELEVRYNDKIMYMQPRSRVLIGIGTPIPCIPDLGAMFFLSETWVSQTDHGLIKVMEPTTMQHSSVDYEFQEIIGLSEGGLYSRELIKSYQLAITTPMEEPAIMTSLSSSLKGSSKLPAGYSASNLFSNDDFSKFSSHFTNWFTSTFSSISIIGQIFSVLMGFYLIIQTIDALIAYIHNFRFLRCTTNLLIAIVGSVFSNAVNFMMHGKLFPHLKERQAKQDKLKNLGVDPSGLTHKDVELLTSQV